VEGKGRRRHLVWPGSAPRRSGLQLFGPPLGVFADFAVQKDGGQAVDYCHVLLRYPRLRVILHACQLAPVNDLRFVVHGTGGSFIKHGLDPQEAALAAGQIPGGEGWGVDPRPGALSRVDGSSDFESLPGDYLAFYAALRDALNGVGREPVEPDRRPGDHDRHGPGHAQRRGVDALTL
jgi:predicted dehydrogenase